MIKAVFIDLDGTLLNEKRQISDKSIKEIERCQKKGIEIILASGRCYKHTINYNKQANASPYIISSNGASIYDINKKKEIYSNPIKKEIVTKLLKYAYNMQIGIIFNYEDKVAMNISFYPDEEEYVKSNEELENIIKNNNIVQCVIRSEQLEKMINLKKFLEKEIPEVKVSNESRRIKNPDLKPSSNYFCDINEKTVSKGYAVNKLCNLLNIKNTEIIAIGDSENDISMFKQTANSVAMENALQSVKNEANYITKSNEEDGVALVLKKL